METPYSTIAVKYVGSTPALAAIDAVRGLHADGSATFQDAVAVTCSAGGQVDYYPIQAVATQKVVAGMGAAGFVLGLFFGGRLRWSLVGAAFGAAIGWLSALLKREELAAKTPFVEKNESMLFMQIEDADWPAFWTTMEPYLEQGLMVLRSLAPDHTELAALLAPEPEVAPEVADAGETEEADASGDEASVEKDDFCAMRGIGPVTSERLHSGGVQTYAQLARMNAEQIAQIAGVAVSRVVNNDWIGQAGALAGAE